MTKAELVDEVSKVSDLTRKHSEVIVDAVFTSIIDALQKGDKIELRGFGSFRIRRRDSRTGRNPKTGAGVRGARQEGPPLQARQGAPGADQPELKASVGLGIPLPQGSRRARASSPAAWRRPSRCWARRCPGCPPPEAERGQHRLLRPLPPAPPRRCSSAFLDGLLAQIGVDAAGHAAAGRSRRRRSRRSTRPALGRAPAVGPRHRPPPGPAQPLLAGPHPGRRASSCASWRRKAPPCARPSTRCTRCSRPSIARLDQAARRAVEQADPDKAAFLAGEARTRAWWTR